MCVRSGTSCELMAKKSDRKLEATERDGRSNFDFLAGAGQKLLFEKLSGVRKLTTFYLTKNDHRWVTLSL